MLQDIRKSTQGTTAKVIIGLIVLAFALWGVENILLGGSKNSVAEVNGEDISPGELQQAMNLQKRRLINEMGDNIDPARLEDEAVQEQAMQELIRRKLLLQSAQEMGLHASDQQIGALIGGMEQFQVDGKFSADLYRAALSEAGYTPGTFKQAVRDDLLVSQLRTGLAASEFATPAELTLDAGIVGEQRDIRYLTVPIAQFDNAGEVSDADIQSYYQAHEDTFHSPESVQLNYIDLRAEDFREPVAEADVKQAYDQEVQGRQYQPENRVSHIMLVRGSKESESDYQKRIDEVQSKLKAGGDFAELAKTYSDDPGSAANGGDLGYTSGNVFPEPMEKAIAGLKVGEVSQPVTTDAGTHFVLVTDRRDAKPPSFEEMRPQLEQRLAMDEARTELLRVVESLKDLAFNAENLKGPAKQLGLKVSESGKITRDQADGLFANASLLKAAFSDDVLNGGMNSDVVELDQDHWVVLRVAKHNEPELLPLADVRDKIVASISQARAMAAVQKAAQDAAAALRAGQPLQGYAEAHQFSSQVELGVNRGNTTLPPELLADAFRLQAPKDGKPLVDYVPSTSGDFYVYEITQVTPGSIVAMPQAQREGLKQLVSGEYAQLLDAEYRQGLREAAEVKVM